MFVERSVDMAHDSSGQEYPDAIALWRSRKQYLRVDVDVADVHSPVPVHL
jgi:hypothetical protein